MVLRLTIRPATAAFLDQILWIERRGAGKPEILLHLGYLLQPQSGRVFRRECGQEIRRSLSRRKQGAGRCCIGKSVYPIVRSRDSLRHGASVGSVAERLGGFQSGEASSRIVVCGGSSRR